MPQEWLDAAKKIGESLKRRGQNPKDAEREGYAIATRNYERKYGVSPRSLDKKKKK